MIPAEQFERMQRDKARSLGDRIRRETQRVLATSSSTFFQEYAAQADALIAQIDWVRALHTKNTRIQCGALGTVTTVHPGRDTWGTVEWEDIRLRCTEPQGHDPHWHKDNIHCYSTHIFDEILVDEFDPRDFSTCTECKQKWPCSTIQALEETP